MKIKVAVYGTTGKSVSLDPNATVGAQIGVNLLMPDGTVASIATLAAALNLTATNVTVSGGGGSIAGQAHSLLGSLGAPADDHPQYQLRSTLFANPTAHVGLTTVNGSAATAMRSDGAPPIDQAIAPTWTGQHTFSLTPLVTTHKVVLESRIIATGSGLLGGGDLTGDLSLSVDDTHFAPVALSGAYSDLTGTPADLTALTFLTTADETGTIPNSRRVLAGNEVAFDDSAAGIRTINLPHVFYGAGPPGISAPLGALFLANNGTTTNDRAYINTDGASAWTPMITAT